MKRILFIAFALCGWFSIGQAQGLNLAYGVTVGVSFRAPHGRVPLDLALAPPLYPFEMHRAGLSGRVSFEVTVRDDGSVTDIVITNASVKPFGTAAIEALRSWKFRPLKDDPGGSRRPLKLAGEFIFTNVSE